MPYQNFFAAKLYTDIGASDVTITLDTAPTATSGRMVLEARNPTQREIIKYTGVSGNQLTGVTRGQGGTTAKSHLKNALVEMNLTAADIQDLYDTVSAFTATVGNGWYPSLATFTSPTYLGNRSYQVTSSLDLTGVLSLGMRFSTLRTVTAPTQCTSLNGTTQYFNHVGATGITFTNNFVVSAWVKLSSYPAATTGIVSRYNGTSGWAFFLAADGTVLLQGYNAGSANWSRVQSTSGIPLNKWVHVTAQLDMATFTATPTTSYVMFDGVDIPSTVVRAGTNPTALVQAGNINVGSYNDGVATSFFPGKIAQVGIFSAKVTQATMRGYISQGLTGSETSLAAAYSFNNSVNDLTANANTLTPNGSAVATNADSPFTQDANGTPGGLYDYAIVTGVTSTTLTLQVPEGCAIPTTGGITSARYSVQKAPFGFSVDQGRWTIEVTNAQDCTKTTTTDNVWYGDTGLSPTGVNVSIPAGAWRVFYEAVGRYGVTTAGALSFKITLSTSSSSESDSDFTTFCQASPGNNLLVSSVHREKTLVLTSATIYYLNISTANSASGSNLRIYGSTGVPTKLRAVNAYL